MIQIQRKTKQILNQLFSGLPPRKIFCHGLTEKLLNPRRSTIAPNGLNAMAFFARKFLDRQKISSVIAGNIGASVIRESFVISVALKLQNHRFAVTGWGILNLPLLFLISCFFFWCLHSPLFFSFF